jgi:hypothetical protein
MATMTQRFHSGWNGLLERIERNRMRDDLLKRNDRVLADMGFSRELLEKGVSSWPWRRDPDRAGVDVTPEMVRYHIANGRQLRAREVQRLAWKAAAAVARTGRALTNWARDRCTRPLGEQNPR